MQVIDSVPTPAIAGIDKGYKKGADELGLNMQVSQSNGDITKDIANVQDAISKGAKGLLIIPLSIDAVRPALKQAVDAGICVGVAYSDITPGNEITPGIKTYFGTDNADGARNLVDVMAKKMGDKGGMVFIGGVASYGATKIIEKNIKSQLAAKHPGIKFLEGQPADYDQAKARSVMQDYVQRYGDKITGVITAADSMSATVADYLDKSELSGKVTIGSFSGYAPFVEKIKEGKAFATVPQPVVDDGARAMQRIAECIEGDKKTVFDLATTQPSLQPLKDTGYVLTADNVDKYTPQY
ncbi:sugar ABC transporter substrate-binding protein [Aeromicrobium sp. NPDC092404]|uniref:sugar ABC transporter substrate-binding protein n=1 Tax=Aeromicrobium sp. NPDC092404 TaxID=3154976 RepID=UPI0034224609